MTSSAFTASTDLRGLSEQEVATRRAAGQGNELPLQTSRTYSNILKDNLLTFINMVLFGISVILILLGRADDVGVIAFVISANAIANIVQEIRAKRKLDALALVNRPKVTVVRDGTEQTVDPNDLVLGDVLVVTPGTQIVVDGTVIGGGEINMDESLLTGESDLIAKHLGDELYSGSFCVSGSAHYQADKVGLDSYANQLTAGAKSFRRVLTPLQQEINLIVRVLLITAIFLWLLAGISMMMGLTPFAQSVENAAVIAGLVPSGLFLMITLAYAMGSLRMADRNALVQQANAVESLSHINMICLDKTGTLTANRIQLLSVLPIGISEAELRSQLGQYAASASFSNATNEAIARACPGEKRPVDQEIPFASAYKWSAQTFKSFSDSGVCVLGAPDILKTVVPLDATIEQAIQDGAAQGLRVLLFAKTHTLISLQTAQVGLPALPSDLRPLGLLFFGDELRPRVHETLSRFREGGIQVKVISGDNPATVAALATQAGLGTDLPSISGPELAEMDEAQFTQAAMESTIFGRITPDQKAQLVKAFQGEGQYVAMMGDGVNDVPSLKQANLGIAMESGSQITRGVADMVLLNDSFEALPDAFLEGQRIRNSIQDVTKISLVRVSAFVILMLTLVMPGLIFPLTIKHNAVLTLLTEGIPTLGVTLWAKPGKESHRGLVRSLATFVLPAMAFLSLFSLLVYIGYTVNQITPLLRLLDGNTPLRNLGQVITQERVIEALFAARSALVAFLVFCGLLLILLLKPPTRFWVGGAPLSGDLRYPFMALAMLIMFGVLLVVPGLRSAFDLTVLQPINYLTLSLLAFVWALLVRMAWRNCWLERFLQMNLSGSPTPPRPFSMRRPN
ncbi:MULTISPECIES: HAD-IC family P-type ATPase [unclassified Leptolyngbya]|uniref:HAD-IC family P-type ATPase n=1 Tax=unclassified Leptolyngbya TaxID=2650499 RepID=UPI001689F0B9|nr:MULTISPECIES: HAD-IC family P-type ATPase [unclassified Leptolyngbya]MBD1911618.1 HAD-IC family P-type ATPase [Leptolyngbya sp. FACHB-8]MBD2153183.1 HAD-IC family P-type ATPase [Leptolyngbya sp. FACHB-16]